MTTHRLQLAEKIKYYVVDHWVYFFYSLFTDKHSNRIYMFHSIDDCDTDPKSFISNKDDFESFVIYINEAYTAASINDVVELKKHDSFAISFDDGFEGVYEYALPILQKLNIPFTVFVTTDFINTPGYLSLQQLQELAACHLCTIGSHTISHPMLRFSDSAEREIKDSKKKLEDLIHAKVDQFAYPYGSIFACSLGNVRAAKCSGYKYAYSTVELPINFLSRRKGFFIPRINGDPQVLEYVKSKEQNRK